MGFDKQCILDIRSVAKDFFCPVCHTLVYPGEALQLQCNHLFCKPCLTHLLNTRRACPHDGCLVTAADSKPLVESNKILAENIGRVDVRCLYYMSGCKWKGRLSECKTHCPECSFGDFPVTCNRCGTKMDHRQVEKHAQLYCPGVRPQPQPQAQLQTGPQTMPHHPSQAVMGHRSYHQPIQQLPPGPPHLQFVHIHPQQQGAPIQMPQPAFQMQPHFSQQQMGPMHPLHYHVPVQQQQYAVLPQGQCPYVTPAPLHVHQHAHQHPDQLPPLNSHPSDGGYFNAGKAVSLDHSRKRKRWSMGWCFICKVDCGTVEGLEMHSQSREHQKAEMDRVVTYNVKKDNARKQKVSSDKHI